MTERTAYFDPDGHPIDVGTWVQWKNSPYRPTRTSRVHERHLKTTYLGFVDPVIPGTRLYGSAVYTDVDSDVVEVDLYDSKNEAYEGHDRHREAMKQGFHCHRCQLGQQHP